MTWRSSDLGWAQRSEADALDDGSHSHTHAQKTLDCSRWGGKVTCSGGNDGNQKLKQGSFYEIAVCTPMKHLKLGLCSSVWDREKGGLTYTSLTLHLLSHRTRCKRETARRQTFSISCHFSTRTGALSSCPPGLSRRPCFAETSLTKSYSSGIDITRLTGIFLSKGISHLQVHTPMRALQLTRVLIA